MLQDPQFANDVQELIQSKQKKSAFVYVRNHLPLIEQALDEGAKIADIYELLAKNGVGITLPTLRLYLHRLRNSNKKPQQNSSVKNSEHNTSITVQDNQLDIINDSNINNKIDEYNVPNIKNIQSIKHQTPNLEELSKAFKFKS
jgi:hypothetical protein